MKYYYKSPAELEESLRQDRKRRTKRRNVALIIVVVDILIILLVFGILYYRGLISRREATSLKTLRLEELEVSASLPGIEANREQVDVFLNIKNNGSRSRRFPSGLTPAGQLPLVVEFQSEGFVLHTARTLIEESDIEPGDTKIVPVKVFFPFKSRKPNRTVTVSLRLDLQGRPATLHFPEIEIRRIYR